MNRFSVVFRDIKSECECDFSRWGEEYLMKSVGARWRRQVDGIPGKTEKSVNLQILYISKLISHHHEHEHNILEAHKNTSGSINASQNSQHDDTSSKDSANQETKKLTRLNESTLPVRCCWTLLIVSLYKSERRKDEKWCNFQKV